MSEVGGRRGLVALMAALSLAACSGAEPKTDGPWEPGPSATAAADVPGAGEPTSDDSLGARLLLNEVGFTQADGESGFVEILNPGPDPVSTDGLSLEIDAEPVVLEPDEDLLGAGERLLEQVALDPDSGAVGLLDAANQPLDRIAWGEGQVRAMSMVVGDFVVEAVEPGTTIGRPPGAEAAFDPTSWVPYLPVDVTPGAANRVPRVDVLLPVDGAILTGTEATLDWYPVPGATSYQVEIATDESFATPVVSSNVTDDQVDTGQLDPGSYLWRVTALAADGTASDVSGVSGFELRSSDFTSAALAAATANRVPVTWLPQHKDSTMLLLEEPNETGPHAWDAPHPQPAQSDPADAMNCALAMVAMVNNYYGGDLTQDRIGFEVLRDRQAGPEGDLMYGYGIDIEQTNAAFAFALGTPVRFIPEFSSYAEAWAIITASIDARRPVAAAGEHHGYVISGYRLESNGHRVISVNDPARGRYDVDLDGRNTDSTNLSMWVIPPEVNARAQELGLTRDRDRDGIYDFDEVERFGTNPRDADSDDDKVEDKNDVVIGVFDEKYGYAAHRYVNGRDWDGDLTPTELDADSDDGGCQDGQEDTSLNGHRNGAETWNFDEADDACFALVGTIKYTREGFYDTGPKDASRMWGSQTTRITVNVELKLNPDDPTGLVDAGSSFTVDSVTTNEREVGGDCSPTRIISKSNGTYKFADPPVPSPGHSPEEIGDGHSSISAIVDRDNGLLIIQIFPYYPETSEETCSLIDIPGLPIVIDGLACGEYFGMAGLGVVGRITDEPKGPDQVDANCTFEGPAFLWDNQKVKTSGTLKLVNREGG